MPRKRIIPTCRIQGDDPGCSQLCFRKFPKNDELKKKWTAALKDQFGDDTVDRMLSPKNIFICDLHFNENCYYYTGKCQKLLLKRECIPSIFINYRIIRPKAVTQKYEKIYHLIEINRENCSDLLEPESSLLKDDNVNKVCFVNTVSNNETSQFGENLDEINSQYDTIECRFQNNDLKKSNTDIENKDVQFSEIKKPFKELDLKTVDFTNISNLKKILKKAQAEVLSQGQTIKTQRKKIKVLRNQLYRYKLKVKNIKSLISYIKKKNLYQMFQSCLK